MRIFVFCKESYSTPEVENVWKSQWKGEMFFSHGTVHSKGVLILIKNNLEFELKLSKIDKDGRFIFIEAKVQEYPFLFVNLSAPNKTNEQLTFFEEFRQELDNCSLEEDCNIVIGGDFNAIFNPDLDGNGGIPKRKESVKNIESICIINDLVDIWRVRNPKKKRFTWRQKTPVIQRTGSGRGVLIPHSRSFFTRIPHPALFSSLSRIPFFLSQKYI